MQLQTEQTLTLKVSIKTNKDTIVNLNRNRNAGTCTAFFILLFSRCDSHDVILGNQTTRDSIKYKL